jgi:hypothetical protein
MSLHHDSQQPLILLLNAADLTEKQQIQFVLSLASTDITPTHNLQH